MTTDLAIVGSGFGGALLAMVARRLGLSVLLLERGTHPRFAIGESTSPLMNLLIEELALRYDLPRLLPLTTFGAWQRTYPDVTCGLKRGFTYFHHEAGRPYANRPDRCDQLLVAASPSNEVSDTHWLRAEVDWFLVREAVALGAEYVDRVSLEVLERDGDSGWTLRGNRAADAFTASARLVVDATGPRGFLSRALGVPEAGFAGYPATQALFSHFTDVRRCDEMPAYTRPADETPPYTMDDAALHHVFEGGWMWVLRFVNGVTSAGCAVTEPLARELARNEGEPAWCRFLARFPTIAQQFAEARAVREFTWMPRLSYRAERAAGAGWAMLPSAAAFVDPLFSTGMPLTLLGVERLAKLMAECWCDADAMSTGLEEYGQRTLAEADGVARYVAACYAAFGDFPRFAAYSQFYFAAASFSELARRLSRPDLVHSFLALDHPDFRGAMEAYGAELVAQSGPAGVPWRTSTADFADRIERAIEPLNVAGLANPAKRNWYPVELEDAVRGAAKLGLSPDEMRRIVATAPWARS